MSDIRSEANLHNIPNESVVPLWRMPMEQKNFSSWSGNLDPGKADSENGQFGSFSSSGTARSIDSTEQQDADIFDVAYKKGWEDGQEALNKEQAANNQASESLSTAISKLNDLYSVGSFEFILTSIEALFRRCAELAVPDQKLLQAWATQLAELVDQDQKGASLLLHPDDVGLIDKDICKLPLRGDEKMLRGNLKLSHSGGWVEKGSEVVLDELRALIDEFSDDQPETKRG